MDVTVARQPIFNRNKELVAYELLFRENNILSEISTDGDSKTSAVLTHSFFSIGLEKLLGGKQGFINFTQNLLTEKIPLLLPKDSIVIELLEDIEPDEPLVAACKELKAAGYTLALDDFVYDAKLIPLIDLATIIKFDFLISNLDEISEQIDLLPTNPGRVLLAEKVETYQQFDTAMDMGFEFFQGYFFCKPEIIKGGDIPDVSLKLLEVVAEVNQEDFDPDKLEQLITHDMALTYKLLRYINSAYYALETQVDSIQQAITYLGQNEIRRFISLVALSTLSEGKMSEITSLACSRAKFCEQLAAMHNNKSVVESEAFMAGLLSLIDAAMGKEMSDILDVLPVSENVKSALSQREGVIGHILKLTESYEQANWQMVRKYSDELELDNSALGKMYLQACQWGNTAF